METELLDLRDPHLGSFRATVAAVEVDSPLPRIDTAPPPWDRRGG